MGRCVNWLSLGDFIPGNRADRVQRWIGAYLQRLGVLGHPGFRMKLSLEGYRDYTFGARSGPAIGIDGIAHEMAHAVEFGPEAFEQRCTAYGFVFRTPTVEVMGRVYEQFHTAQASQREIRAFAIERRLVEMAGLKVSENAFLEHVCSVLGFMPDWIEFYERADLVAEQLARAREVFTEQVVRQRLFGWLDKTAERLQQAQLGAEDGADDLRDEESRNRSEHLLAEAT